MDACHSGMVDQEEVTDGNFAPLKTEKSPEVTIYSGKGAELITELNLLQVSPDLT
jgi:hypothetical protein